MRGDLIDQLCAVLPDPQLHRRLRQRQLELLVLAEQTRFINRAAVSAGPAGS
ncbi:hypothetical protein GS506_21945 [Rhodococcus hoagii]|nr:hypothetical protein [Prescottella equi]